MSDDALFVTISPAEYFAPAGVAGTVAVFVAVLWLEQPCKKYTHDKKQTQQESVTRFCCHDITFCAQKDKNLVWQNCSLPCQLTCISHQVILPFIVPWMRF